MGVAMSILLGRNDHDVIIWSPFEEEADTINKKRGIPDRLPGVYIKEDVFCTTDICKAVTDADMIVMAVPSQKMRETARKFAGIIPEGMIVASCTKGIEDNSYMVMSQILEQELTKARIVALSGPSYAIEIAEGMPTSIVAASKNLEAATICQDILMNSSFRVYTSLDILGVELGGALKNIIAFCAGICDGLEYGDNTKAALLTRGIREIARLGVAMGAELNTFFGLTGIGDLMLTSTGKHSRNRLAGMLLGQGMPLYKVLREVKMVVEGITATKPAFELAKKYNVEMPIVEQAFYVIYENKDPRQAVLDLMGRDKKLEWK